MWIASAHGKLSIGGHWKQLVPGFALFYWKKKELLIKRFWPPRVLLYEDKLCVCAMVNGCARGQYAGGGWFEAV